MTTDPTIQDAHPTLAETTSRLWNRLPSLWKALVPALAALLIVLVPASVLIGSRIRAVTTENLRAEHGAILADIGNTFEEFLARHAAYVSELAASDAIKSCAAKGCADQTQSVFANALQLKLQDVTGYYTELGFIDTTGKETARVFRASGNVVSTSGPQFSTDPAPLAALGSGQVYVFPISRDTRIAAAEPYQYPVVRFAAPVVVDGTVQGYVTSVLNLDDFFAQNFVFSDVRETQLLDTNGCLVASSDDARRPELYKTWRGDPDRPCYPDLQLQDWDTSVQRYQDSVLSTKPLHGLLSNSGQTWTLIIRQPAAQAYAEANTLQALLALAHLTTVIFVAGLIIVADRATAQLRRAALSRNVAHARDIRFNPYQVGGAVEDPTLFFGRKTALAEVIGAGVMGGDDVLIEGDRHIGKTSLLRQVERRLRDRRVSDPAYWYWPIWLSLRGVSADVFYTTLMDQILRDVEDHATRTNLRFHQHPTAYSVGDFREDIIEVLDLPNTGGRPSRMVLCLDNIDTWFDGISGYTPAFIDAFYGMLMAVGNQLKMIATGTHIPVAAFDRSMTTVNLVPLERDEAERLIRKPVEDYYTFSDEAVAQVLRDSNRLPMELQRLSHHAIQNMLETDSASVTTDHAERALQRAIDEWEPTFRLLWNGGTDRAGNTVERLSDEARTALMNLAAQDNPVPESFYAGPAALVTRTQLDDITFTNGNGVIRLTELFKLWLARSTRS